MIRAPFIATLVALFTSLLFSLPLLAQEPIVLDTSAGQNVLQTSDQLRRVPPPSKTATVEELEQQADALRGQKNYADSIDYYRAAIKKKDTAALENKAGISELLMQHVEDARERFERAVRLDKNFADALNNLGVAYYEKRNYRRAIKSYSAALKVRPESSSFHSNLGSAYFANKQFDKATAEYMTAMEIDPEIFLRQSTAGVSAQLPSPEDRAKYHFTIAKAYASHGDADHCLLYLRKALEEGFPAIDDVYKEAEFKGILQDPRFVTLMASKPVAVK